MILGIEEVDPKLNAALTTHSNCPTDPTTIEKFKTIFKYLAFVASAAKAPVRQKMLDETLSRIAKAGEAKNIQRWCWWTPTQLSLLEQANKLSRVILIGGNGTGKTVMLDEFAKTTATVRDSSLQNLCVCCKIAFFERAWQTLKHLSRN